MAPTKSSALNKNKEVPNVVPKAKGLKAKGKATPNTNLEKPSGGRSKGKSKDDDRIEPLPVEQVQKYADKWKSFGFVPAADDTMPEGHPPADAKSAAASSAIPVASSSSTGTSTSRTSTSTTTSGTDDKPSDATSNLPASKPVDSVAATPGKGTDKQDW